MLAQPLNFYNPFKKKGKSISGHNIFYSYHEFGHNMFDSDNKYNGKNNMFDSDHYSDHSMFDSYKNKVVKHKKKIRLMILVNQMFDPSLAW